MTQLGKLASAKLADLLRVASVDQYQETMFELGAILAATYAVTRKPSFDRFHILSAVEDFEGLAAGVIHGLQRTIDNKVTYSCMWPRPRVINESASIEICPIDQAFHQKPDKDRYHLLLIVANVGSVTTTEAMLMNAIIDCRYQGSDDIDILSPVVHEKAIEHLNEALPKSWRWAGRVHWTSFRQDLELTRNGFTAPGVGGTPGSMAGFQSSEERENYIPPQVRHDFDFPLDPGPDPEPSSTFVI